MGESQIDMGVPTSLSRARREYRCQDCGCTIEKGDTYYNRGMDYAVFCLPCYEARYQKWKAAKENSIRIREEILNGLFQNDFTAKYLHGKYGGNYIGAIRKLKEQGYPIMRLRDKGSVVYGLEKEDGSCVCCRRLFYLVPLYKRVPSFLCEHCIRAATGDPDYLARILHAPNMIYSSARQIVYDLMDRDLRQVMICLTDYACFSDDEAYASSSLAEEGSDAWKNERELERRFLSLRAQLVIHLAWKARVLKIWPVENIAGLLCLGLARINGISLTRSQMRYRDWLVRRIAESGLIEAPCSSEPCNLCQEAMTLFGIGQYGPYSQGA